MNTGRKQNHAVAVPTAAPPVRSVTEGLDHSARGFHLFHLSAREESDELAVGRPEWIISTLSSGQQLRRRRMQRTHPQKLLALPFSDESNAAAVWRDHDVVGGADCGERIVLGCADLRPHDTPQAFGFLRRDDGTRDSGPRQKPTQRHRRNQYALAVLSSRRHRSGNPRLRSTLCNPLQLQFQIVHALKAFIGVLGKGDFHHAIQRRRRHRTHHRDRLRLGSKNGRDYAGLRFTRERPNTTRHLIQHCAQRENVRARIRLFPFHLFRRHVLEGSHDRASRRQRLVRRWPGKSCGQTGSRRRAQRR